MSEVLYPRGLPMDELVADVDRATGLIRWYVSKAEYLAAQNALTTDDPLTPNEWEILEGDIHENVHRVQMAFLGFPYRAACDFLKVASQALAEYEFDLRQILRNRSRYYEEWASISGRFDRQASNGITARGLLESQAIFEMKNRVQAGISGVIAPSEMSRILVNEAAHPDYRNAFELAFHYLEDAVSLHFGYLVSLSLCAEDPAAVFEPMIEKVSRLGAGLNMKIGFDEAYKFLNQQTISSTIGFSIGANLTHPFLQVSQRRLAAAISQDGLLSLASQLTLGLEATGSVGIFPPLEPNSTPGYGSTFLGYDTSPDGRNRMVSLKYCSAASLLLGLDLPPMEPRLNVDAVPIREWQAGSNPVIFSVNGHDVDSSADSLEMMIKSQGRGGITSRVVKMQNNLVLAWMSDAPSKSDPAYSATMRKFFERIPNLAFFLPSVRSDLLDYSPDVSPALAAILLAFEPGSVQWQDGMMAVAWDAKCRQIVIRYLAHAADYAESLGLSRSSVLDHVADLPESEREAIRAGIAA